MTTSEIIPTKRALTSLALAPRTLTLTSKRLPLDSFVPAPNNKTVLQDLIAAAKKSLENLQNFLDSASPVPKRPALALTDIKQRPAINRGCKSEMKLSHPFDPKNCMFVFPPSDPRKSQDSTPKFPELESLLNSPELKPVALFQSHDYEEEKSAPAVLIPDDLLESPDFCEFEGRKKKSRSRIYMTKHRVIEQVSEVRQEVSLEDFGDSSYQTPPTKTFQKDLAENKKELKVESTDETGKEEKGKGQLKRKQAVKVIKIPNTD